MLLDLPPLLNDIFFVLFVGILCAVVFASGLQDLKVGKPSVVSTVIEWLFGVAVIGFALFGSVSRPWVFGTFLIIGAFYIFAIRSAWKNHYNKSEEAK